MEATQEKSLQHNVTETLVVTEKRTPFAELDNEVKLAIECAGEKKAFGIVALDLREIANFAEFFVICTGANQRQVQAICDEIQDQLKKQLKARPVRIEGYSTADWVLMDYGDFIIHAFEKNAREFYDLERLWRDAKKVEIPKDFVSYE